MVLRAHRRSRTLGALERRPHLSEERTDPRVAHRDPVGPERLNFLGREAAFRRRSTRLGGRPGWRHRAVGAASAEMNALTARKYEICLLTFLELTIFISDLTVVCHLPGMPMSPSTKKGGVSSRRKVLGWPLGGPARGSRKGTPNRYRKTLSPGRPCSGLGVSPSLSEAAINRMRPNGCFEFLQCCFVRERRRGTSRV
jgi:hypothetical protein